MQVSLTYYNILKKIKIQYSYFLFICKKFKSQANIPNLTYNLRKKMGYEQNDLVKYNQALLRPSEYFRSWIEHYDGRQIACFYRIRYYDGRQSISAIGESIMTGDRVLAPIEQSILTRDRVLPQLKKASQRASECLLLQNKAS